MSGLSTLNVAFSWEVFSEKFLGFFRNFSVVNGFEIVLFFLLIYYVSKILRDNDATRLMVLYWVLIATVGIISNIEVYFREKEFLLFDKKFYLFFVILLSMFMLLLFQTEVKKRIWDLHGVSGEKIDKRQAGVTETRNQVEASRCSAEIIKAVQNMSRNNVGALIVLAMGKVSKQVIQSGVALDAEISSQLIEGIFVPKAPLHDGAMIIRDHRIVAAGCFLPLTQKTCYPKGFGTRHRAGIGITEASNVISLIVSEETGIISIVKGGGVVERYADYEKLADTLSEFYWKEMPKANKNKR